MTEEKVVVDEKYTIIVQNDPFAFKALRYGEEWINDLYNVQCSHMIMAMFYRILELEKKDVLE